MNLARRVAQLENRVADLEGRSAAVERQLTQHLDGFGGYRSKTRAELGDIRSQLMPIVATLEAMVGAAESQADKESAKALLRRARNNLTRASRAAESAS